MSRIMAHRGARNLWAENSLLGFRKTLEHGFDAVEFDVHLTDAGEMVVIHDATLDRTTDGSGPVRDLTPEARRRLRLRGPDGRLIDECPPTLDEVLALLATDPMIEPWVELKSDAEGRPYPGLVEKAVEAIRAAGLARRSALHSFNFEVVARVREIAPELRRLISVYAPSAEPHGGLAAVIEKARGLADILGVHDALFEAEFDLIAREWGIDNCSVWTINAPALMPKWIDIGPGFIVSDDPVTLKSLLHQEEVA
jgi:glycerophosphoryl diester phosphodiesterase